jgi:hypothetical protein
MSLGDELEQKVFAIADRALDGFNSILFIVGVCCVS